MMKKAVAYYRTSGKTGKSNAGDGLQVQIQQVRKYAAENDITITAEHVDDGISGAEEKLEKRTGLMNLLAELEGHDLILVKSTDRLWRDDATRIILSREIKKAGKDIRSVDNPKFSLYSESPADYLINGMMELLDTYQRMEITLKLHRARRNRVKRTMNKACGAAPIGYVWRDKKIVVDEEKREGISQAWNQYLKLGSISKVAQYLHEHGIRISDAGTRKLLRNDFYIGVVRYGDVIASGDFEPLVSKVQFGKVQKMLKDNRTR